MKADRTQRRPLPSRHMRLGARVCVKVEEGFCFSLLKFDALKVALSSAVEIPWAYGVLEM